MRQKRIAELEEKQGSGSLTGEESAELDRAKKTRERFEALKQRHAAKAKDRAERRRTSKRDALKRHPGLGNRPGAAKELRKNARRLAHLERARDVAEASNKAALVARIDALISKEKARHQRWLERHASRGNGNGNGAKP
jgi:hypothetical protein